MKKAVIKRKRKIASALVDYWIITKISRQQFVQLFNLDSAPSDYDADPSAVRRTHTTDIGKIGTRISNGQTVELDLPDSVTTIFAATIDGLVTEEIDLEDFLTDEGYYKVCISTRGGFASESYPCFVQRRRR